MWQRAMAAVPSCASQVHEAVQLPLQTCSLLQPERRIPQSRRLKAHQRRSFAHALSTPQPFVARALRPALVAQAVAQPPALSADEQAASDRGTNEEECRRVLKRLGRTPESLPADLASAVRRGSVPGAVVQRFADLENSALLGLLLRFGGFKERLLADDLFLTKVGIEVCIGICTKTSAELERRRDLFFFEFDFVIADVIMAIIADFMLTWLPAPTVPLRPPVAREASALQQFLRDCPENAFQVPLRGTSFSLLQRLTSILRNGAKLFVVGTTASLFGTGLTNALILLRELLSPSAATPPLSPPLPLEPLLPLAGAALPPDAVPAVAASLADHVAPLTLPNPALLSAAVVSPDISAALASAAEVATSASAVAADTAVSAVAVVAASPASNVDVPILATSLAYGAYMALSSNLRYQLVAGVIEQRLLEPWLRDRKALLAALSFVVRTGNTFVGSLL